MPYLLRGALIEYGKNLLGPIPNIVIFQFNPEKLTRNVQITNRPNSSTDTEQHQAGEHPVEKISFTANFSAADELNSNNPLARTFGIGPRLAALEKMAYPKSGSGGLLGAAVDAVGNALTGGGHSNPTEPVPRLQYPRVLFIWGLTRINPVIIESIRINELQYDNILNPIQAEVELELSVINVESNTDDKIAKGAYDYSKLAKDTQALLNLANTAGQIVDLIPF